MTATLAPEADTDRETETVEARLGVITLTRMGNRYTTHADHKTRSVDGEPQTFDAEIELCDCRTNEASHRLRRPRGIERTPDSNTGQCALCPKAPGHNKDCHKLQDHCTSGWHAEHGADKKIAALFKSVVASYR